MAMNISNCSVIININNCVLSKTCNKCKEIKPLAEFNKNKKYKDGYQYYCKTCMQKYYEENKEGNREKQKKYQQDNKNMILERQRNYQKEKYHSDEQFKLYVLFKSRIYHILSGRNKSKKTLELLDCSLEQLKNWLSYQFTPEMNWDNYSKYWVVDHILPCSAFDLTNKDEVKKCYNYTNLQPLEKIANIQKSNKRNIEAEMNHTLKVEKFKNLMNTPLN